MLETRPPTVADTSAPPPAPAPAPEPERAEALAAEVARAVRDLRIAAGLSERAAARALGTSQTQLRRMEDPRYLPSLRSLARVAAAYGHRLKVEFEPRAAAASKAKPVRATRAKPARPRRRTEKVPRARRASGRR